MNFIYIIKLIIVINASWIDVKRSVTIVSLCAAKHASFTVKNVAKQTMRMMLVIHVKTIQCPYLKTHKLRLKNPITVIVQCLRAMSKTGIRAKRVPVTVKKL